MGLHHQHCLRYHRQPTAHADAGFILTGVVAGATIMKAIKAMIGVPPLRPQVRTRGAQIKIRALCHLLQAGVVGVPLTAEAEDFVGTITDLTGVHTPEVVVVVAMLLIYTRVHRGVGHRRTVAGGHPHIFEVDLNGLVEELGLRFEEETVLQLKTQVRTFLDHTLYLQPI